VNVNTQFQIAERAYFIWKQKGCPEGKALDNWLQAEAEAELSRAKTSSPSASANTPQERRSRSRKQ
jgi:hypothetical protein